MSKRAVWRRPDRLPAEGVDGLLRDATRPPGKKPIEEDRVKAAIDLAMSPPPAHARHWTVRALADKTGMAVGTMHRILKGHGLRPHQVKTFKVSRDPRFELKVRDVAGLYVNPPDHAVVLSVDEKPQIQALGSTQTSLPMTSDHEETRTHDYRRHGTARLLAALDVATGKVVGRTVKRHRSAELLSFPGHVAERGAEGIGPGPPVHVVLDNVSFHRSAEVRPAHRSFTPRTITDLFAGACFYDRMSVAAAVCDGPGPIDARGRPRVSSCMAALEAEGAGRRLPSRMLAEDHSLGVRRRTGRRLRHPVGSAPVPAGSSGCRGFRSAKAFSAGISRRGRCHRAFAAIRGGGSRMAAAGNAAGPRRGRRPRGSRHVRPAVADRGLAPDPEDRSRDREVRLPRRRAHEGRRRHQRGDRLAPCGARARDAASNPFRDRHPAGLRGRAVPSGSRTRATGEPCRPGGHPNCRAVLTGDGPPGRQTIWEGCARPAAGVQVVGRIAGSGEAGAVHPHFAKRAKRTGKGP